MPTKFVRSISLAGELTALNDEKVDGGYDRSAIEVIRAALRLRADHEHRIIHRYDRWKQGSHDG